MRDPKELLWENLNFDTDKLTTQFSPNVVCISVSQPGLPALSFYDLPGIIGQAESIESQFLVKFVRDLVSEYIEDAESLVLVTCSLANDIANSSAGGIAREKNMTDRCIGVLTKPDCLPNGSRAEKLQSVLDGKRFQLGHGYFVVKNPGQDLLDSGLTHRDARTQEDEYFARNEPWSSTLSRYQDRFGTMNLQKFLGIRLAAQMLDSLPHINEAVHNRLQEIDCQLSQLPETPLHNASRTISDILYQFSEEVRKELVAEYPARVWENTWGDLQKEFMDSLAMLKPSMKTVGDKDADVYLSTMPGKSVDDAYIIESADDDDDDDDNNNMKRHDTVMREDKQSQSKKRKVEDSSGRSTVPSSVRPSKKGRPTPGKHISNPLPNETLPNHPSAFDINQLKKVYHLDEVAKHLDETSKTRVPDKLQPKVVEDMMLAPIEHWKTTLNQFFTRLQTKLTQCILELFNKYFQTWCETQLYLEAWTIVEKLLTVHFIQQREMVATDALEDELEGPYIFHEDMFKRDKAAVREAYRKARLRAREKIYFKSMAEKITREVTQADKDKVRKDERKMSVLMMEPYEREVDVIATMTSYYLMASRRFHDAVCMRIKSDLFKNVRKRLRDELELGLGIRDEHQGMHDNRSMPSYANSIPGSQNAMRLLAEPLHRQARRNELRNTRQALLEGQKYLNDMQQKPRDVLSPSRSQTTTAHSAHLIPDSFGPALKPIMDKM